MDENKKELYEKLDKVSDEICLELDELAGALSPENLTCDGECTRAQVDHRYKKLMLAWYAIELKIGFEVDPEDYEWYFYKYREEKIRPRG